MAAETPLAVESAVGTGELPADVTDMAHDEWQVLEEEKPVPEPAAKESPADIAAEEDLPLQEKVVEELDLDDLEEFGDGGSEVVEKGEAVEEVKADPEAVSSDLRSLVEELSREVRLLKEENRGVREMLEGVFVAAGKQIDILRVMREGLSGSEDVASPPEDQSGREGE